MDIYNENFLTDLMDRVAGGIQSEAAARHEGVPAWDQLNLMQKQVAKQNLLPIVLETLRRAEDIEREQRDTALLNGNFAVHFGVYPDVTTRPSVDGHGEPSVEHEIALLEEMDGVTGAYVSGSWGCWGPADQSKYDDQGNLLEQSEGDLSLHVVFYTDSVTPKRIADLHALLGEIVGEGRILDYAIISDRDDWSQQTHMATIGGNPHVCVHETSLAASGRGD